MVQIVVATPRPNPFVPYIYFNHLSIGSQTPPMKPTACM